MVLDMAENELDVLLILLYEAACIVLLRAPMMLELPQASPCRQHYFWQGLQAARSNVCSCVGRNCWHGTLLLAARYYSGAHHR